MSADSQIARKNQETGRAEDPNVVQRRASTPSESVWVNASAGTGKTKVLTDRVLRLLLPRKTGEPGTKPHRILCLTYTKAAATEMAVRIHETLSKWAVIDDKDLREALEQDLLGHTPTPDMMTAARKLFIQVLDSPGGLNIMTIHSFCQSVLGRFPVEAKVPPHFKLADDVGAAALLSQARDQVIHKAQQSEDERLTASLSAIVAEQTEEQFMRLLNGQVAREMTQLRKLIQNFGSFAAFEEEIAKTLKIKPSDTAADILKQFCERDNERLPFLCETLATGTKTNQAMADAIQGWIEADTLTRARQFDDYAKALIVQKTGEPRKINNAILKSHPETQNILAEEVRIILQTQNNLKATKTRDLTTALLYLSLEILKTYDRLKRARALLDYEDLIARTRDLLDGETNGHMNAPWVMFKLDGGIDHILVDEAQDTNPEQWDIIERLTQEFFSGAGQSDVERTVFVVGDEKQSIYSFQRAAPEEFYRMREDFAQKLNTIEKELKPESMLTSFRSTKSVLRLVDACFARDAARKGVSLDTPLHDPSSTRRVQAGRVELWPLYDTSDTKEDEGWSLPVTIKDTQDSKSAMAADIAGTIRHWLDSDEILQSYNRPVEPGDILILVRTRRGLFSPLVKALKDLNIPVSGVDRMVLNKELVIQDLLAIAQFALLPADDLTLATILKSPIFGLSEEELFDIAARRDEKQTVWDALLKSKQGSIIQYCKKMIERAANLGPYDFFSLILQEPCPTHEKSGLQAFLNRLGSDILDPVHEFMNAALSAEKENGTSIQAFIHAQGQSDAEIKREMDQAGNAVRIMTVHGAKGLQAPIVFLPDTLRTALAKKTDRLLWPDKTKLNVPLWSPRKDDQDKIYAGAFDQLESLMDDEYRRLLYVAMTRAEERLYISAAASGHKAIKDSWYNYISAAFDDLDDVQTDDVTGIRILKNEATGAPDKDKKDDLKKRIAIKNSGWAYEPMPEENIPPRPLMPSRPSESEPSALSPLKAAKDNRYKRGNIIHTLLQMLPDVAQENREAAAAQYLAAPIHDLSGEEQKIISDEVLTVLNHPDFAPIFGEGSQAEVPITGMLDDQTLISGQIDRILITDDEILIVDYKTNRPPPDDPKDVPQQYLNQMEAYKRTIEKIYPNRPIKTALLWTYACSLMEV